MSFFPLKAYLLFSGFVMLTKRNTILQKGSTNSSVHFTVQWLVWKGLYSSIILCVYLAQHLSQYFKLNLWSEDTHSNKKNTIPMSLFCMTVNPVMIELKGVRKNILLRVTRTVYHILQPFVLVRCHQEKYLK